MSNAGLVATLDGSSGTQRPDGVRTFQLSQGGGWGLSGGGTDESRAAGSRSLVHQNLGGNLERDQRS